MLKVSEPWFLSALVAEAKEITVPEFPAMLLPKGTTLHSPACQFKPLSTQVQVVRQSV